MGQRVIGTCDACGKRYRLADPQRAVRCRACEEGYVRVPESPSLVEPPAIRSGMTINPRAAEASIERRLERAAVGLARLRRLFWLDFALGAVVLALYVYTGPRDVSAPVFFRDVALFSTAATGCLIAAFQRRLLPLPWAATVAGLWLISALCAALESYMPSLLWAFWGASLLALLPTSWQVFSTLRAHPDEPATLRLFGPSTPPPPQTGTDARSRSALLAARTERRRSWTRAGIAALGLYSISGAAAYTAFANERWIDSEAPITALARDWSAGSVDALLRAFPAERRTAERAALASVVRAHGWVDWPPAIPSARTREGSRLRATFDIGFGPDVLIAEWTAQRRRWVLDSLVVPPPRPVQEPLRLVDAWNAGDVAEIAALFRRPESDSLEGQVRRLLQPFERFEQLPRIDSIERAALDESGLARQVATFEDGRTLLVGWKLGPSGVWALRSLDSRD